MNEQISALMDGELALDAHDSTRLDPIFSAMKTGGESAESWATYHLIGDVMRGNPMFKPDFQQRMMQRLEKEATVLAPHASKKAIHHDDKNHKGLKMPAKWSIAASVAAVAFVGWMALQLPSQNIANITANEIAQNVPAEYLVAHQASASGNAAFYVQPASYSESAR
ncbi:MAG: sigma-E factor negative regulatory protein [Methylophilaceae bacterium]|nr:sigma-E factor negative regulatory protein [Methylophilaceae bacterium]